MCSGVFIVEDIESRETDVRDFFLTERNYRCRVLRRCIACRTNGCPGCAARQRQRPSDSQYRCGFRPTPSLRSLLRVRHGGDLPYKLGWGGPSQTDCSKSAAPAPSRGQYTVQGGGKRRGRAFNLSRPKQIINRRCAAFVCLVVSPVSFLLLICDWVRWTWPRV